MASPLKAWDWSAFWRALGSPCWSDSDVEPVYLDADTVEFASCADSDMTWLWPVS
jgi:hypothetical protein